MSSITLMGMIMMIIIALVATETRTRVESQGISLPDCPDSCGDVKIPYPFGTSKGCYLSEKFWIDCDQSLMPPKPFLGNSNRKLPLSNISLHGELVTTAYITRDCYDQEGKRVSSKSNGSTRLWHAKFNISYARNKFVAVGCDTFATVQGYRGQKKYTTGCISSCSDIDVGSFSTNDQSSCSGVGCCQTSIPSGLRNITVYLESFSNHTSVYDCNPCSYAFVVQDDQRAVMKQRREPTLRCKANANCVEARNGPGYLCRCKPGYEGNPYHTDGCQDIDECPNAKPDCSPGNCNNLPGTWECSCPKGYNNNGTACIKNNASDPQRPILLYVALANELEGLINLDKHPCGKGHLYPEETDYLLGSPSNTYENSSGESGFKSGATTIGFDSMQIQMFTPYDDAR
ncbi:hypothetical protein FEM48_Zijuj01G0101700 [Ziziphus jujuba var. spinosa]|uniref:EGF-like domain-containing protein n=1 Tax=Ziziphus jujuba var. spinosa TaxID=714518 RepID=A0A978W0M8_ZIZJJ|nr:hypothetical protein FEM48_Zijuj01G0101700 [Ziziphus jujuba var. spinosa]